MNLIRKIQKAKPRTDRWKSQRHLKHVRSHACCACDSEVNIEAAHLRNETDGGMGRKPSDYFALPLCGGPEGCHARQHRVGEETLWSVIGKDPFAIIEALIASSPMRSEINGVRSDRELGITGYYPDGSPY